MVIKLAILAGLGLAIGSFINALVWRIHEKKDWIRQRSQCPNCHHQLAARDLVPVLSWLALRGRCRYCHRPISVQYPVVELATAVVFALSYYFWPDGVAGVGEWLLFITWLATSVGLMALLIYDLRWMLLPNKILYPTAAVALVGRLTYLICFEPNKPHGLLMWLLSVGVASGIFWLIYELSKGNWIGYGDVRLGLITGTILASPIESVLMIFLASVLGTILVIPSLIAGRQKLGAKLPYGPFLITATFIVLLFGASFIDWYNRLLAPQ
jgi:prepilin signal peptidase PulO-like enzyme (type II secretory pathway)